MKNFKRVLLLILGGGAVYVTLYFKPSLLITAEVCTADSTATVDSTKAVEPVLEVSPAVTPDTAKTDSIK